VRWFSTIAPPIGDSNGMILSMPEFAALASIASRIIHYMRRFLSREDSPEVI